MRIKISNSKRVGQCPQQKLKFLSFIDDLRSTKPLYPTTPERKDKDWVMDAWEDHVQTGPGSPGNQQYITQMMENYEEKKMPHQKRGSLSERI